jgi:hypothetical protein
MRAVTIARATGAGFTVALLIAVGVRGCRSTSSVRQTNEVTTTPQTPSIKPLTETGFRSPQAVGLEPTR